MKFYRYMWSGGSDLRSVQQVLDDRAIVSQSKEDLHDPFLLLGMREAVERIERAVSDGELIYIYGDYDVDGITSCAILMKYFERIGARCNYYIPNRVSDGYGLSVDGLAEVAGDGAGLVITVDCGINAFAEVEYANSVGLDVVVTDHHLVEDRLPAAVAVVNPKRGGYPFEHLAGCGVALKLVQALAGSEFERFFGDIIDIAAVGTVADIVSLTGENRIIVKEGLARVRNLGLRTIIEALGKRPDNLSTTDISFGVAPVINASGRIGNPKLGVELLLMDDKDTALRMAKKLISLNNDRKQQCSVAGEDSMSFVEQNLDLRGTKVIIVRGDGWHSGIIGIVASRLVDKYKRPAIVLTETGGQLKGSARSIAGVSIYGILSKVKDLLSEFGGHDLAAGVTVEPGRYDEFVEAVQRAAEAYVCSDGCVREYDYVVAPSLITMDFISELAEIQPCGMGNSELVLTMHGLKLTNLKYVGVDEQHAKVTVTDGVGIFDGIGFGIVESFRGIRPGDDISIMFVPEISYFGGVESVSLKIVDIHSGTADFYPELQRAMDKAMADFLINSESFSFTSLPDFDIIKKLKSVDVYTFEDMKKLQKWVYDEDLEHEIVFGDEEGSTENGISVRFMPVIRRRHIADGNLEDTVSRLRSGAAFIDHVPHRKDVEAVYHACKRLTLVDMRLLVQKLRRSAPRIIVALELLNRVGVLDYLQINDYVHLEWKRPETNPTLEELELFQKLQRETSIGGGFEQN